MIVFPFCKNEKKKKMHAYKKQLWTFLSKLIVLSNNCRNGSTTNTKAKEKYQNRIQYRIQ